jgi:hypothetical protein
MPKRKSRRRPPAPVATTISSGERLPSWVFRGIERGRLTEDEYRREVEERRERRRADMISRVPPLVAAAGPEAVEEWADEWLAIDPRLVHQHRREDSPDPRAPLTHAEAAQR